MRIAYLDESGTPEATGNTTHFVLVALVIPGHTWKAKDQAISAIKGQFGLEGAEIHAAWLNRRYADQEQVADFARLSRPARRLAVQTMRDAMLLKRAALRGVGSLQSMKANFRKTEGYIHLTHAERQDLLRQMAERVSQWTDACLFADCINKQAFARPGTSPFEEAFDQVVTRFHRYLTRQQAPQEYGLLVQDRNDTVADRLTQLMRQFHERGTRWTSMIPRLIETPLFFDSRLTSMVQVADVCSYALPRYLKGTRRRSSISSTREGTCLTGAALAFGTTAARKLAHAGYAPLTDTRPCERSVSEWQHKRVTSRSTGPRGRAARTLASIPLTARASCSVMPVVS